MHFLVLVQLNIWIGLINDLNKAFTNLYYNISHLPKIATEKWQILCYFLKALHCIYSYKDTKFIFKYIELYNALFVAGWFSQRATQL